MIFCQQKSNKYSYEDLQNMTPLVRMMGIHRNEDNINNISKLRDVSRILEVLFGNTETLTSNFSFV